MRTQVWVEAIVVVLAIVLGSLIITSYFLRYTGGGSLIAQSLSIVAKKKAELEQNSLVPITVTRLEFNNSKVDLSADRFETELKDTLSQRGVPT